MPRYASIVLTDQEGNVTEMVNMGGLRSVYMKDIKGGEYYYSNLSESEIESYCLGAELEALERICNTLKPRLELLRNSKVKEDCHKFYLQR